MLGVKDGRTHHLSSGSSVVEASVEEILFVCPLGFVRRLEGVGEVLGVHFFYAQSTVVREVWR